MNRCVLIKNPREIKMKRTAIAIAALALSGTAAAQWTRGYEVRLPGFTYQSSSNQSAWQVQTPVYSFQRETTYSPSYSSYQQAYDQRMQGLRSGWGGAYVNPRNDPYRQTQDLHTYGLSYRGYGVSGSTRTPVAARSASEEALHTWSRTENLRMLPYSWGGGSGAGFGVQ